MDRCRWSVRMYNCRRKWNRSFCTNWKGLQKGWTDWLRDQKKQRQIMALGSMSLDNVDGILRHTMGELHWMLKLYGRWIEKEKEKNGTPVCDKDAVEIITHKLPWIRLSCLLTECLLESNIPTAATESLHALCFFLETNDASTMQLWDLFLKKINRENGMCLVSFAQTVLIAWLPNYTFECQKFMDWLPRFKHL